MSIRPKVYAALFSSTLLARIPIRPDLPDPGDKAPFVVYSEVYGRPANVLSGKPTLTHHLYQVDCYSNDPDDADRLAQAAEDVLCGDTLPGLGMLMVESRSGFDQEAKLYRVMRSFSVWC